MTFTATTTASDNTLGKYLKILSMNGVYGQLSENAAVWANIMKKKKGAAEGRERRFLLRQTYGMAASQFLGQVGAVSYPTSHRASITEGTALYKDFGLTIEMERNLIARAVSDMSRYGEPLAEEMKCKTIGMARMLSAAVYQDGSGRIGEVSAATAPAVVGGQMVVTLATLKTSIGHVGWFDYGDKVKSYDSAGAAQVPSLSSGTHSYWTVEAIDRVNDKVTLKSWSSADLALTVTAANQVGSGDFFCRSGITANDWASQSTNDYGNICEAFVGFESLFQDDSRKVHGITLSGATKGTRKDALNQPIDSVHFQNLLSLMKVAVGEGAYKWKNALMAPEVLDALVESRETDRRFTTVSDNTRGVEGGLGYQHGKDKILFESDEYCPKTRIYVLPDSSDVIQFYGSTFDWVRPEGGSKFQLRPDTSGGHYRQIRAYMEGSGLLLCMHPQACGVLTGFTY